MYPWEGTEMIKSLIIIFWDSLIVLAGRELEYPALRQSTASPINHYSKSKQRFMSSNTTISNLYLYWEKYLQQQPVILPQIICLITAGVGRSQTPDRVLSWSWEGWWLWQGSSSTHQLIFISLEHYVPDTVQPTLAYNKQMLTAITTFQLSPNIIFCLDERRILKGSSVENDLLKIELQTWHPLIISMIDGDFPPKNTLQRY